MSRKLPIRRTLPIAALALVAATALTACAGQSSLTSSTGKPVYGGTLTYLQDRSETCLDPEDGGDIPQAMIGQQITDDLVYEGPGGRIEPWLATNVDRVHGWPQVRLHDQAGREVHRRHATERCRGQGESRPGRQPEDGIVDGWRLHRPVLRGLQGAQHLRARGRPEAGGYRAARCPRPGLHRHRIARRVRPRRDEELRTTRSERVRSRSRATRRTSRSCSCATSTTTRRPRGPRTRVRPTSARSSGRSFPTEQCATPPCSRSRRT